MRACFSKINAIEAPLKNAVAKRKISAPVDKQSIVNLDISLMFNYRTVIQANHFQRLD